METAAKKMEIVMARVMVIAGQNAHMAQVATGEQYVTHVECEVY